MSRRTDEKAQNAFKKRLAVVMKDPSAGNKYCAECNQKQPRWTSTNLGIFICIDCAGIHRKLGVHISKCRSTNLDLWTEPLVRAMERMGNKKANSVYEYGLSKSAGRKPVPGDAAYKTEAYIRDKYINKRWWKPTKSKKKKKGGSDSDSESSSDSDSDSDSSSDSEEERERVSE